MKTFFRTHFWGITCVLLLLFSQVTYAQNSQKTEKKNVNSEVTWEILLPTGGTYISYGADNENAEGGGDDPGGPFGVGKGNGGGGFGNYVGDEEFNISMLSLYPNPTTAGSTIRISEIHEEKNILIYDLLGHLIAEIHLNAQTHQFVLPSNISRGEFMVFIEINNQQIRRIINVK